MTTPRGPNTPHRVSSFSRTPSSLNPASSSSATAAGGASSTTDRDRLSSITSPHTPHGRISLGSTFSYSSPGSSLHQVEDPLVFEIGARVLRAGFANEPSPRCVVYVRPELFGRVGIKGRGGTRANLKIGEKAGPRVRKNGGGGEEWELWGSGDLSEDGNKDVGIVEDAMERLFRDAYNKYLLVDSKTRRLLISISPLLPVPYQTAMAQLLFSHFQPPTITFVTNPVMETVAAGLRSALVMDIGWHETTVTPVYEMRTILAGIRTSRRASKSIINIMGQMVRKAIPDPNPGSGGEDDDEDTRGGEEEDTSKEWWRLLDWEEIDDVVSRAVWCKNLKIAKEDRRKMFMKTFGMTPPPSDEEESDDGTEQFVDAGEEKPLPPIPVEPPTFDIPFTMKKDHPQVITGVLPTHQPKHKKVLSVPFDNLSAPAEIAFFSTSDTNAASILSDDPIPPPSISDLMVHDVDDPYSDDDSKQTLPFLLYSCLLRLPVDIRAACLPRIVITGGASSIPGLKSRIIAELKELVEQRGWNPVRSRRLKGEDRKRQLVDKPPEKAEVELLESEKENIREKHKLTGGVAPGTVRGLHTLGAWAGASLIAGARIKGTIEVEREKFMSAVAAGGTGFAS